MTPTTTAELVLLDSEPGAFAFYSWANVMIACWSKGGTGPAMRRMAHLRQNLAGQFPNGVSVVYLIADGAGLPDAEARVEAKLLMERFSGQRACLAIVVHGSGFWVSAMRAAVIGPRMLVRSSFSMDIFGNEKDAVAWLHKLHESRTGIPIEPRQLLGVLQQLSAAL